MLQRMGALVMLILLTPFLAVLCVLVKLDSKGKFLFRQKRLGKDQQPFWLYKIRTMRKGAEKEQARLKNKNEADGPVFKIRADPRYTHLGQGISHTGLDEIPQLINIIKGEMAFVGPRPLPENESRKIPEKYHSRFRVLPGITSLWVVRGAQHQDFERWMSDDLEYVRQQSIWLDLQILGKSAVMLILMLWRQIVAKH